MVRDADRLNNSNVIAIPPLSAVGRSIVRGFRRGSKKWPGRNFPAGVKSTDSNGLLIQYHHFGVTDAQDLLNGRDAFKCFRDTVIQQSPHPRRAGLTAKLLGRRLGERQLAEGTVLGLRINVDGRSTSPTNFDPGLVQNADGTIFCEDSLVMLYRPNAHFPWAVHPDIDVNTLGGDTGNGYARITANGIGLGDYCVAWRKSPVGVSPHGDVLAGWRFYPNPANDQVTIEVPRAARGTNARIVVYDMQGRVLLEQTASSGRTRIDLNAIAAQEVFVTARVPGEGTVAVGRLNVVR